MILSIVNKAVSNFFHFSAENNYLFGIHKIIALAELMNGNNLFPFMVKDFLYITNRNSIDELNDVVESGMYMIIPGSDTYGTLLVFQAGVGAAGATVQRYFHPSGLNITRIKNSNSENSWAQL